MRVPSSLLRQRLTIEDYTGETGSGGPAYGPPRMLLARVEGTRKTVRTAAGVDVITSAVAYVRPGAVVAAQARATCEGRTYTVVDVIDGEALTGRASHRELMLS